MIEIVWLDKKIQKKGKNWIDNRDGFLSFVLLQEYSWCIESWWIRHFCAQHVISYFSYHAYIHHTRHQVKYSCQIHFQGSRNMRNQLEARISAMEHVQKENGHEIREIKKELARLAKLIEPRTEAKVMHPQEFSPSPIQPFSRFGQHPNPRPSIPIASNEACRPNLRHPLDTPKTMPVHTKVSLSSNQSSSS